MTPSVVSDERLIDRFLRDRDEPSFLALYRRHSPVIYRVAWRQLGGRAEDAADCVQETWCRALAGLPGFRRDSSLRTWLCGIAYNLVRERRRRHPFESPSSSPPGRAHRARTDATDRIDLERAIAGLPNGYRDVIVLHDIEGFTHDEIAAMLACEAGTSRSQLHHARRSLRAILNPTGATP